MAVTAAEKSVGERASPAPATAGSRHALGSVGPSCPSPNLSSSTPSGPVAGPRAAPLASSTSAWCKGDRHRRRRACRCRSPSPCAGCPLRNEITNRVTAAVARPRRRRRRSTSASRVMTDEERAARPRAAARRPRRHRRQPARPRPRPGPGHPVRRPGRRAPGCCSIASGKGGVGKSSVTDQPGRRPRPAGHARSASSTPTCGASRSRGCSASSSLPVVIDSMLVPPEAHGVRVHLDGLLRRGGPAGHLAGPDAAQGARAVPHRRLLGRARLPRRRPAARHRRHLDLAGPVPAPGRGLRRHHAAAGGPEGGPAGRVHGPQGQPRRSRASSRT